MARRTRGRRLITVAQRKTTDKVSVERNVQRPRHPRDHRHRHCHCAMPSPASFLPLTHDTLLILLALGDEPAHGYGIIRDVEVRTGGEVALQTGALYRTLKRMLRDGFIVGCAAPATADSDDARRRYYRVTRLGAAVRAAEIERMSRLVHAARLGALGKRPRLA